MNDLRFAVRQLAKRPGFTAAAVTTLALGFGATTAIVSLADAALFRRPAVREADRLAMVYTTCRRGDPRCASSYPDYVDYRDRAATFEGLAAYSWVPLSVGTDAGARPVVGQVVTGNYFSLLGMGTPAAGRLLQPADDPRGAPGAVIVLSHDLWRSAFAGAPDVVGRIVRVNDAPFTVVGVAPHGFRGLELGGEPDAWLPMSAGPLLGDAAGAVGDPEVAAARGNRWIHALVGRLANGATIEAARADMARISAGLQQEDPDARGNRSVTVDPFSGYVLPIGQEQGLVRFVALLLGVVALTLLLATANLANLLLARALSRHREMGVRLAAGADRLRIARQLVVESLVLAVVGGVTGLGIALWTLDLLSGFALPGGVTIAALDIGLDARMAVIAAGITLVAGCAFGLVPAVHASRADVMSLLRGDARVGTERSRLRWALVSVQVALCLVLLIGSGLFLRTLRNALEVDLGFHEQSVVLARFNPALARFSEDRASHFVQQLLERTRVLPGIEAAAVATLVPLQDGGHRGTIAEVDGYERAPDEEVRVEYVFVSEEFFHTLGVPIHHGRDLRAEDVSTRAVVVNETMAGRYWSGRNPVGGRLHLGGANPFDVVGVSGDVTWRTVLDDPASFVFLPIERSPAVTASGFLTLAVRTSGSTDDVLPALREIFLQLAPSVPVTALGTMDAQVERVLMPQRFGAFLLTLLGFLAVVLAVVGVYGVVSYTVSRETRTIGVRLAVGATSGDIVRSVIRRVARPVVVGLGVGVVLALVLARAVGPFLVGVPPADPLTFIVVTASLLVIALAAGWVPARRASRVDPMEALRHE